MSIIIPLLLAKPLTTLYLILLRTWICWLMAGTFFVLGFYPLHMAKHDPQRLHIYSHYITSSRNAPLLDMVLMFLCLFMYDYHTTFLWEWFLPFCDCSYTPLMTYAPGVNITFEQAQIFVFAISTYFIFNHKPNTSSIFVNIKSDAVLTERLHNLAKDSL